MSIRDSSATMRVVSTILITGMFAAVVSALPMVVPVAVHVRFPAQKFQDDILTCSHLGCK